MNRTLSLYVAMLLAGVAGYLVLWLSVRRLEPVDYEIFATFWSALYFLVGSLAGFQQEVTRATLSTELAAGKEAANRGAAWKLAIYSSGGLLLLGAGIGLAGYVGGGTGGLPESLKALAPITFAVTSYVLVAVIGGSLYGLNNWSLLAWMIFGDAILRFILVVWTLNTSAKVDRLFWDVSIPFGLTIILLAPFLVKALRGKVVTDVPLGRLWLNSSQAVLAAVGMSLMVSGFPVILSLSSTSTAAAIVSQGMFIVTFARAPFVIVAISLQSLLLVKLKAASNPLKLMGRVGLIGMGISALLIPVGILVSRPILELLVGAPAQLSEWLLTSVVLSGLLLGYLVVTGVAVLARSQHVRYATGWAVAATLTIFSLVLPIDFELCVMIALLVPPTVGIAINLAGLTQKVITRSSST